MCSGEPPTLYGGGTQTRDFVHVEDVAGLLVRLGTGAWAPTPRAVYNVGTGQSIRLLDLVTALSDVLLAKGMDIDRLTPNLGPARSGDIDHSVADVTSISTDLGWRSTVTLQEGLSELVDAQLTPSDG